MPASRLRDPPWLMRLVEPDASAAAAAEQALKASQEVLKLRNTAFHRMLLRSCCAEFRTIGALQCVRSCSDIKSTTTALDVT